MKSRVRTHQLEQNAPPEIRALIHDLLVPEQSEPFEALENPARALLGTARPIRVLDAQQKVPAIMLDEQPVEESGARDADVEVARRRWCEAKARFGAVCHR